APVSITARAADSAAVNRQFFTRTPPGLWIPAMSPPVVMPTLAPINSFAPPPARHLHGRSPRHRRGTRGKRRRRGVGRRAIRARVALELPARDNGDRGDERGNRSGEEDLLRRPVH